MAMRRRSKETGLVPSNSTLAPLALKTYPMARVIEEGFGDWTVRHKQQSPLWSPSLQSDAGSNGLGSDTCCCKVVLSVRNGHSDLLAHRSTLDSSATLFLTVNFCPTGRSVAVRPVVLLAQPSAPSRRAKMASPSGREQRQLRRVSGRPR